MSAKAYFVTGAGGTLASALEQRLGTGGRNAVFASESELDITDPTSVDTAVQAFAESFELLDCVLINAAAYTDVERAESERDTAFRVNEQGARYLARACAANGVRMVHVSTDFVFDGHKTDPYTEDDTPNPLSVYGSSKLAGEIAVLEEDPATMVVRTAWLYGDEVGFPSKILELAATRDSLSVVSDEVGSPTYVHDLAEGILRLAEADAEPGVYHLVGGGSCSRAELATATLHLAGIEIPVTPVLSSEFPTVAVRPHYSVLDCSKATKLGVRLPEWRESLGRFVAVRTTSQAD